jgi:hypothetical protein
VKRRVFYIGADSRIRSRAWNARIGILLALGFILYLTDKTLFDKQAFTSPSAQLFSMAFFKTKMPALDTSPVSSPVQQSLPSPTYHLRPVGK